MPQDPTNPSDIEKQVTAELTRVLAPSLEAELRRARYQDQIAGQNAASGQSAPTGQTTGTVTKSGIAQADQGVANTNNSTTPTAASSNQSVTPAPAGTDQVTPAKPSTDPADPSNRFTAKAPDDSRPGAAGTPPAEGPKNTANPLPNAPSRENALNQEKNKDKATTANQDQADDKTKADQVKDAKTEDKDKNKDKKEDEEKPESINKQIKRVTGGFLTGMWGAVWLDWTLLTLVGLNAYFVGTWFTDRIAQFGEDSLFGRMLGKELGKWFEIILLFMIDAVIIGIIFAIGYVGYKLSSCSVWQTLVGATKGALSSSDTTYEGIIKACFKN